MKKSTSCFTMLVLSGWIIFSNATASYLPNGFDTKGFRYSTSSSHDISSAATTASGDLYIWAEFDGTNGGAVLYGFNSKQGELIFQSPIEVQFSYSVKQTCRVAISTGGRVYAGSKNFDAFQISVYNLHIPEAIFNSYKYSGDEYKTLSQCGISASIGDKITMWGNSLSYQNGHFSPVNQQFSPFPDAPQFTQTGGYGWIDRETNSSESTSFCLNEPSLFGQTCTPLPEYNTTRNATQWYLPRVITQSANTDHFLSSQWLANRNQVAAFGFNKTLAESHITDWEVFPFHEDINPPAMVITTANEAGSAQASMMFIAHGDTSYWNVLQNTGFGNNRLRQLEMPEHLKLPTELRSAILVSDDANCLLPPENQNIHQFYTTADGQVIHVYLNSSGEPVLGKSVAVNYLQGMTISKAYTLVSNRQLVVQAGGESGNNFDWRIATVDLDQFDLSSSYLSSRSSLGDSDLSSGLEILMTPGDINYFFYNTNRWALIVEDDQQRLISLINDKPSNMPDNCGILVDELNLHDSGAFGVTAPIASGSFGTTTEELKPCIEKFFTNPTRTRTIYPMRFRSNWEFFNRQTQLGAISSCSSHGCDYYWQPRDCQAVQYNVSSPKLTVINSQGKPEPGYAHLVLNIANFSEGNNPTTAIPTVPTGPTEKPVDNSTSYSWFKPIVYSAAVVTGLSIIVLVTLTTYKFYQHRRSGYQRIP